MPTRYYEAVQKKKASDERSQMRSAKLLKERTQESLASDGHYREADRFGKLHVDEYEESVETRTLERR
jgi:ribosomal protein L32